jgi:hypothetical protein
MRYRDADNEKQFHNFARFWRSLEGYVQHDEDRRHEPEEMPKPRRVIAASKYI